MGRLLVINFSNAKMFLRNFHKLSVLTLTIILIGAPLQLSQAQTPVSVTSPIILSNQSRLRFTGTITSDREAEISPRVAGLVATANKEMGHAAQEGDLLVSLDDTLAKMDLQEKELNLEAARAELANAKRRFEEAVELGDANFPRSERENRETTYRMAEIAVSRMQTMVQTQAEIVRLDIQVPEKQLTLISQTKTVKVEIPAVAGGSFEAHIEARSPLVDPKTRTFQVRIHLDNPDQQVKPGMSAEAVFVPNSDKPILFISRDAILRTADGEVIVWVAVKNGQSTQASRRVVDLGASSGDNIQVLSGLEKSDRIIYQGNELLQDGQEIRIVESVTPITR
jgi:membrane fusion protein (multidrug efflux system)